MLNRFLKTFTIRQLVLLKSMRLASACGPAVELLKKEFHNTDKIVRIVLNDSKRRNALSLEMIQALHGELDSINTCKKHHVVILAAEGPCFSSGHDLKQLKSEAGVRMHKQIFDTCSKMLLFIQNMEIPVIAEVNGLAFAAGCQMVASCDIAIAGRSSKFAVPGVKVGLFCSTPGIALARTMCRKKAFDMLLTGDVIDAERALQAGLLSRVVEDSEVKEEAMKVAENIASYSRSVVALGKQFFYSQSELSVNDAYRMGGRVMVENLRLNDCQEGIASFVEKRKPVWSNRDKKVH